LIIKSLIIINVGLSLDDFSLQLQKANKGFEEFRYLHEGESVFSQFDFVQKLTEVLDDMVKKMIL
jgi:hypothetical protein